MNGKNPFEIADESYEPCDPSSQPNPELVDYIKEPVDQWILEHGVIEAETYQDARSVWTELGDQVIPDDAGSPPDLDTMEPHHIRKVRPAVVKQFAERLKPMIFESIGLAAIPLDLLAQIEDQPVIIGQMFGVPREGAYAPVLILTSTITKDEPGCLDELHMIFHLLNDIYSDDPTEVQVMF